MLIMGDTQHVGQLSSVCQSRPDPLLYEGFDLVSGDAGDNGFWMIPGEELVSADIVSIATPIFSREYRTVNRPLLVVETPLQQVILGRPNIPAWTNTLKTQLLLYGIRCFRCDYRMMLAFIDFALMPGLSQVKRVLQHPVEDAATELCRAFDLMPSVSRCFFTFWTHPSSRYF